MAAELRVGTLRLPDRRTDADALLRRLDLARGADRRVLVVRRLVVDLDEPDRARQRLDELRRHAARPAKGPVDPHAESVEFADEAEALRCLSEDLALGVAGSRWWWHGAVPGGDVAEALTTIWTSSPRWVPAALGPLLRERPQVAETMASLLTPEQVLRVIAAVTAAYSDPAPAPGSAPGSAPPAGAPPAELGTPALPPGMPASSPAAALLLGLVRLLDERPAAARTVEVQTWLSDVVGLAAGDPVRPAAPDRPAEDVPGLSVVQEPAPPAARTLTLLAQASGPDRPDAVVTALGDHRPRTTTGEPDRSWRHTPWAGSGPSTHTELASMLYAINLVRRFGLDDLAAARACAATGWAVVEAVGRWLLRGVPLPRRRTLLSDPLLSLLADLDGRPTDLRTPVRLGAAVRPVRRFLTEHAIGAETFTQSGTVLVSRTHVDVVLGLEQIDLAARSAGLDRDPGWVPDLGRVVLFHFEGPG